MTAKRLCVGLALVTLSGCTPTILTREPPAGRLEAGRKVLADDGSCPAGEVKQVTGAASREASRQRECIPRPAP